MVTFDLEIVEKVRDACTDSSIPMSEDVVKFLLGYYLQDGGSEVAFEVGKVSTELAFSPDVDVLEIDGKRAIGYEIKGVQNTGEITKNQLYTGLGQAHLLKTRPLTFEDGSQGPIPMLRKSYLVYPQGSISASEEWIETFIEGVEDLPSVGLMSIGHRDPPETIVDAEPNIPPDEECAGLSGLAYEACRKLHGERLKNLLSKTSPGKSVKNPQRSLEVLAEKVADEHNIDLISFT